MWTFSWTSMAMRRWVYLPQTSYMERYTPWALMNGCDGGMQIPFNFLAGIEGIPAFDEHLQKLSKTFTAVSFSVPVMAALVGLVCRAWPEQGNFAGF